MAPKIDVCKRLPQHKAPNDLETFSLDGACIDDPKKGRMCREWALPMGKRGNLHKGATFVLKDFLQIRDEEYQWIQPCNPKRDEVMVKVSDLKQMLDGKAYKTTASR